MAKPLNPYNRRRGAFAAALAALLILSACGGSSASTDTDTDTDTDTEDGAESVGAEPANNSGESSDSDGSIGDGSATLTMPDATVYSFTLSECKTADNSDLGEDLDGSYTVTGTDANGFEFTVSRVGIGGEVAFDGGSLTNADAADVSSETVIYVVPSGEASLTVSGESVTGSLPLRSSGPASPHGDDVVATLDVTC